MSDRLSPALRWAVAAPRGVAWLTTAQRLLLSLVYREAYAGRRITTASLATAMGAPRGQTWNRLARLRQLGLIGFRAYPVMERTGRERTRYRDRDGQPLGGQRRPSPGCEGRLLLWIPRPAREARRRAIDDGLRWRDHARNALTSTPWGFSRERATRWWTDRLRRSGSPPGVRAGPRRGRRPPVALRAHCPAGHPTPAGRFAWRDGPPTWIAEYRGHCRPCDADVVERLEVELGTGPLRPLSPAELADPAVRTRRVALARDVLEAPHELRRQAVRVRLERDYLAARGAGDMPSSPGEENG